MFESRITFWDRVEATVFFCMYLRILVCSIPANDTIFSTTKEAP